MEAKFIDIMAGENATITIPVNRYADLLRKESVVENNGVKLEINLSGKFQEVVYYASNEDFENSQVLTKLREILKGASISRGGFY